MDGADSGLVGGIHGELNTTMVVSYHFDFDVTVK